MCRFFAKLLSLLTNLLNFIGHFFNLGIRIWLFIIFTWQAGLLKLSDWDSTLTLFEYEYTVPFIPAHIAAYLGTAAEIILPSLLLLGFLSRFNAVGLFIFNAVALFAYPALWNKGILTAAGFLHVYWGIMIAMICCYGPGKISIDYLLHKKCGEYQY